MKYILFILLICLTSLINGLTQEISTSSNYSNTLDILENKSSEINTLKGSFIQNKTISSLSIQVESSGLFYYKKNNRRIRWEYSKPSKFTAIFNNGEFGVSSADNSALPIQKQGELFTELNTVIISSLEGSISRLENFERNVSELESMILVSLIPKGNNPISQLLSKIDVYFNLSDYAVVKIELFELNSDITSISLQSIIKNSPVSDNLFTIL